MVKKDPLKVDGAHITIVGHITCEEVRRSLSHTEFANGFANRFLWTKSERSKLLPERGALSEDTLSELATLVKPAVDFGRTAGLLQVLRLSMILALLDCSTTIRRPHLEAALAICRYCELTAEWMFGSSLGDSTADDILGVLRRSDGMTRNEIMNYFHRHKASGEIERALHLLKDQGHVDLEWPKTDGRRAQLWRAVEAEEFSLSEENNDHTLDDDGPGGCN
ncbi:MAG: helix-turn-helix domain-containing protein [Acidobacteriaceae bacterium]